MDGNKYESRKIFNMCEKWIKTLQKSSEIFNKIQYRRQSRNFYWCLFLSTQVIFV
jgi:hypothetical protein